MNGAEGASVLPIQKRVGPIGTVHSVHVSAMGNVTAPHLTVGSTPGNFRMSPAGSTMNKLRLADNTPATAEPAILWPPTPSPMAASSAANGPPMYNNGLPGMVINNAPAGMFMNQYPMQMTMQLPQATQMQQGMFQMPVGAPMSSGAHMVMMQVPAPMQQTSGISPTQMQVVTHTAPSTFSASQAPQTSVRTGPIANRVEAWADVQDADDYDIPVIDTTHFAGRQLFNEALNPATLDNPSVLAQPLPSMGSAPHGTGRCNPCAWFYKAKGCQNDAQCTYCHLCPDGELKNRKKAKVAALRSGAAEPAAGGGALKLSSLV